MKNLLDRDDYLKQMNEGFIKDTIKKGVNAIKNLFKIGMKKINDFIAIFDKDGKVLPVISPQAIIDKFSSTSGINVYASKTLSDSVVAAGGKGCENTAPEITKDEDYDFGPKGKKFAKWMTEGKYKDTIEYKNLMSVPSLIQECYECSSEEARELFEGMINEDWEGIKKERVRYHADGKGSKGLDQINSITPSDFEEKLDKMIKDTIINAGKVIKRADGKVKKPWRNILVFGAPGIGKSTIPNMVINKYNKIASSSAEEMSFITVDCPNIAVGDFMMPTMPSPKMVQDIIRKNPEAFPKSSQYLNNLTPKQESELQKSLNATKQFEAGSAPKSWLPSYKKTGDNVVDALLNDYANGGVYTDDEDMTHKTGNGGIIMFDEFLRTDPNVFKQLMIFLLTREMEGWTLGSKWVIIACSNRPCDDQEVEDIWDQWSGGPAAKDRFERMVHLEPNPEEWSKWARSKGCDELLLKFIFDPKSMSSDEYPRWHSIVRNSGGSSTQVAPISPRRWQSAFEAINSYEIDEDYDDITEMSTKEIRNCIEDIFDKTFVEEIITWLEDHMNSVSIDEIIKDPVNTYLPKKFSGKDQAKAVVLIQNIWEQFEDKYQDKFDDIPIDEFMNIMIWFGRNYKGDFQTFNSEFYQNLIDKVGENIVKKYYKVQWVLYASWPEDGIKEFIDECIEIDGWPEDSWEQIKKIMKEYFPWRLDGDKILYYDEVKLDD